MAAPQGNLYAQMMVASATPVFLFELPASPGETIAYWSVNFRISGHDTQETNVDIYVGTTQDANAALRLDGAKIAPKGSFSLECLLRSVGDCFFIKNDQGVPVHIEGIYELAAN